MLSSSLFDCMEKELALLEKLNLEALPIHLPTLGISELWKELNETPADQREAKFAKILKAQKGPLPKFGANPTKPPIKGAQVKGRGSKDTFEVRRNQQWWCTLCTTKIV